MGKGETEQREGDDEVSRMSMGKGTTGWEERGDNWKSLWSQVYSPI